MSHPIFMISHHAMTSHPLYSCHHTQYTCLCILCSCVINYCVLMIKHLLYVWHQTHYMYDITWFSMTSHSLFTKSQYCIDDFTSTLFMTAPHSIWHHILYTCDITATVSMTRHFLWLWHHTHYVGHLTWCTHDGTTTVSEITLTLSVLSHPLDWWYLKLSMFEITPSGCRTP